MKVIEYKSTENAAYLKLFGKSIFLRVGNLRWFLGVSWIWQY